MSRIPAVKPESLTPEQRQIYDTIASGPRGGVRGPFLALLHVPELADRIQHLGEYLRYKTSFPPQLSELAICVTARHSDSPYEFYAHSQIALKAGVSQAVIDAVARQQPPEFSDPDQALVYQYANEIAGTRKVSDAAYAKVLERFGTKGLVELTALCGYYSMMAFTLNAHQVPLPPGVKPAF